MAVHRSLVLTLPSGELTAWEARGRFAVCALFELEVRVELALDETPPEVDDLLGVEATLKIVRQEGDELEISGIVFSASTSTHEKGHELSVVLTPKARLAAEGLDSTVLSELSAKEAIEKVLQRHAVSIEAILTGSYAPSPHWLQHRESDWAFVERIAASVGMFWYFDLSASGTPLTFADDSTAAPAIEGEPLVFTNAMGLRPAKAVCFGVEILERVGTGKVLLREYTPEKPQLSLEAQYGDGEDLRYEWAGGYSDANVGKTIAERRAQALLGEKTLVRGAVSSLGPMPGRAFSIEEHPHEALGGQLFCTALELHVIERQEATRGNKFDVRFEARPLSDPHRAPIRPLPVVGPSTAHVVGASGEEILVDKSGRVRAQLWSDRDGKKDEHASTPARVVQPLMENSLVTPRIGWEVLVAPELGRADRPMVLGTLYDAQRPPPYALPGQRTITAWKTATSLEDSGKFHEIKFDDKSGSELVHLHSAKDARLAIDDAKQQRVGNDHQREVLGAQKVHVKENASLEIKQDQSFTVGVDEKLEITKDRTVDVRGKQTARVDGSRKLELKAGIDVDVDGDRKLQVGATMKMESEAGISVEVLDEAQLTVGGANSAKAKKGMNIVVGKDARTTIGAARLQKADKGFALDVEGKLTETIGAAAVFDALGDASEASEKKFSITIGGALLGSAPTIEIVAEEEIAIVVGGSSLTIKKNEIELKSAAIAAPAPMIVEKGSKVQHNP